MRRFLLYTFPLVGYFFAMVVAGHIPVPGSVSLQQNSDKLIHLLEYLILGFLILRFLKEYGILKHRKTFFIASGIYAALDELLQSLVPGRHPSIYDFLADIAGLVLIYIFHLWRERYANSTP